jgi:hypothetical protein
MVMQKHREAVELGESAQRTLGANDKGNVANQEESS